ncbi:M10 family metallopeptidase C-terminal domain-containing protein, partial [Ramlibacter sp. MAHUQ-53]|uniref:M10 family metallopeptidase C-terminal domain-containing protein n=1 Tax=unclassified Ramlibacter TaxID=2617605 RepID=UPI003624DB97
EDDDEASDSVGIGEAIVFEDDGPSVAANGNVQLDDDALTGGNPGGTGDDANSTNASGTLGHDFGEDDAGSVEWLETGAPTGFSYLKNGDDLEVRQGSRLVLTITLDTATGAYAVTQNAPIMHPAGDNENNVSLTLNYRVTDGDDDTADGTLVINVDDDTPIINARTDLIYANGSNPAPGGTGVFSYSIGADVHTGTWSQSNSDFASVTLHSGTIAGYAIKSMDVDWQSEDGDTAVFSVSFEYLQDPGAGTWASGSGTLTFDKDAGTYHLSMGNPFPLVPMLETAYSRGFTGYEVNSHQTDKTQPMVSVATVSTQFYAQFTGIKEPGSGTGSNNLKGGTDTPNTLSDGELFTQAATWVSISNVATGVASDTIQKGEVLDMDFFTYNPHGFSSVAPDARIDGVFLKFDGIKRFGASGEDFVVVLKLVNDSGVHTTRAVVVENGDIYNNTMTVPAPYAAIPLDNNDGLVVIERNDYNPEGQTWRIEGMQILTTTEGVNGSGYNLQKAVGSGGGSTGLAMQPFDSVTNDNDVMKITSIGFLSSFTPDADLHFDVAVQDADGDVTATQRLDVSILGNSTFIAGPDTESIQGRIGQGDAFVFNTVADSPATAPDVITGFVSGLDRIDLVAIDAVSGGADDAFTWINAGPFTNTAGQLRYDAATFRLQGDVNGDGNADFVVVLSGVASVAAGDLML